MSQQSNKLLPIIIRGARCKCPNCGEGEIFKSYLEQVDICENCGEALGHISADDGSAWLTIMLVGHIILPILFILFMWVDWPLWGTIFAIMAPTLLLTLLLLPRSKGVFIGVIWHTKIQKIS
jgi:uncharacterized protein (DUF983 family)